MDFLELAKQLSTLGAAGVLGYIYLQWQSGHIHSDSEIKALKSDAERDREYRELLRREVTKDRRASDERVDALTQVIRESNDLTRRLLEFNERLVADIIRDKRYKNGPRDES